MSNLVLFVGPVWDLLSQFPNHLKSADQTQSWTPYCLSGTGWCPVGTGRPNQESNAPQLPAAFPLCLEPQCKVTYFSTKPSALPPSCLSFSGFQSWVGCCGVPRRTGGEGESSAPKALPCSCWHGDSSGAPCLSAPLIAAPVPLAQLPGQPESL